ncbi:DNA polymerase III subunit beta [Alienimonas californiensis]|uniref:Beta sliding clamp n=1 Tax=Alienimonas californiensis TaxID=2527989 RepID=A0A517P6Z0_9PLAN|nr:DNA polymerase III subunit beta [Alienimonas californiensis]QDT15141.1 DNA polymerase III subunit beta [Alienimonas californiensis]
MKLHCARPALAAAFTTVGAAVPTRTPKEILRNVRIDAEGDSAVLSGTDSEVGVRVKLGGVTVERPGSTLLPAQRVQQILRELNDDTVHLELGPAPGAKGGEEPEENDAVWIRAGHSEFRLSPEDPAEFPPVADFEQDAYHTLSEGVLKGAIRRTLFATDTESTRYALGGVLVEVGSGENGGETVTFAATDSRRLAVVEAAASATGSPGTGPADGPVIPAKALGILDRVLGDADGEVFVTLRDNDVLCKAGDVVVSARLVEGRFPRYRQVIPAESKHTIEMVAGPFYSAVRQAQIVTSDETRGVDFTFEDGNLTLTSRAADVGASKIELPVPYDGEAFTITFDPRFVADFLKVLEPEATFTIGLNDPDSAAVLRTGGDYTYVIMPLSRDR